MLKRLLRRFRKERMLGIEMIILPDNQIVINGVELTICGDALNVTANFVGVGSLSELSSYATAGVPICLVISGRGVLCKRQAASSLPDDQLIQRILPNARIQDFYMQSVSSSDHILYAVSRRDMLEELVANLHDLGHQVIAVNLAPVALHALAPLIENDIAYADGFIPLGYHRLQSNEQSFDYTFKENREGEMRRTVLLGGQPLEERLVAAYGGALKQLTPDWGGPASLPVVIALEQLSEYHQKQLFTKSAYAALSFFLMLLVANMAAYMHYAGKQQKLEQQYAGRRLESAEADTMRIQIAAQEAFLRQTGWFRFRESSFYADRIAATVPESIRVDQLSIHSFDEKKSKLERKAVFDFGQVRMSGHCGQPTDLNRWMRKLETLAWAGPVEINQYAYDDKTNNGYFLVTFGIK
jgi:Tfp pilus assembly protein PilN